MTKNMVVGESVYGEKRISVEVRFQHQHLLSIFHTRHNHHISHTHMFMFQDGEVKMEYRAWNPFRSKLAAAILGGIDQIHIKPGAKVMYLGAASGTTVSHVSDIVGPVRVFSLFHSFTRQMKNKSVRWCVCVCVGRSTRAVND